MFSPAVRSTAVSLPTPGIARRSEVDDSLFTSPEHFRARFQQLGSHLESLYRELAVEDEFDRICGLPSTVRSTFQRSQFHNCYVGAPLSRIIEALEESPLNSEDVFCDLGAGLFRVPMFIRCWTGYPTFGVEYDTTLAEIAIQSLRYTGLDRVTVKCSDVVTTDFSFANVFFLYFPFSGPILHTVLENLKHLSEQKPITIWWLGDHLGWPNRANWLNWEVNNLEYSHSAISVARSR